MELKWPSKGGFQLSKNYTNRLCLISGAQFKKSQVNPTSNTFTGILFRVQIKIQLRDLFWSIILYYLLMNTCQSVNIPIFFTKFLEQFKLLS